MGNGYLKSICRNCGKPIHLTHDGWKHIGRSPAHKAQPMTEEDKKELAAGQSGG